MMTDSTMYELRAEMNYLSAEFDNGLVPAPQALVFPIGDINLGGGLTDRVMCDMVRSDDD